MRSIEINEIQFFDAFGRDVDFHDMYQQCAYLDQETGEVIWVFENDEDAEMATGIEPEENRAARERIDSSAGRYLEIPGREHGEHHDILREFLNSNWTEDKQLKVRAQEAYSGSIGRWIENIDNQDVVHAYYEFRDRRIREMAEEFLSEHDIDPLWR